MSENSLFGPASAVPGEIEAPHVHAPGGELAVEPARLPVPGRHRVQWRVAALVISLGACRGRTASTEVLHILSWAVEDKANMATLRAVWTGEAGEQVLRRVNPLLDSTVRLATQAGLVVMTPTGRQKLTERGERLLHVLRTATDEVMTTEIAALASLGLVSDAEMSRRLGDVGRRGER